MKVNETERKLKLKLQIKAALERISRLDDADALKRLHSNIQRHPDLEDADREMLDEAVIQRLRVVSPTIATRLAGPREAQGRIYLEALFKRVSDDFDLSGNQLKNGMKTGGYMISGARYIDVYISYKTKTGRNLSISWIQENVESKPYIQVLLRHVGVGGAGEIHNEMFEDQGVATECYVKKLAQLLNEGAP